MGIQQDRVKFNVGGRIFETTSTTLALSGRNTFFGALFDDDWNLQPNISSTEHFLDRNPECFSTLLDLLRTGELHLNPSVPEKLLLREAQFYGLLHLVRAAKFGPFDSNRLRLSCSVTGRAPGDGIAIRAGPDGGCAVAHGSIVHVYDWTMEEHPALNLDYQRVNDVVWAGPEHVAVGTCERVGRNEGGMGIFGASVGDLRHKFQVAHNGQIKSYTAGALCFDGRCKIYSSCKGRANEYGIGVWDLVSGKQVDFFYEPSGWSLGDADRVQWLDGCGSLLVSTLFPRKDNCYISLLDFRAKNIVWCWSDRGPMSDQLRIRDAIAVESKGSVCVVNEYANLGFMDFRRDSGVGWRFRNDPLKCYGKMPEEPCYPKLGLHDGHLFSSMNDVISVFSGPEWVLTSRLKKSYGGSICDFSVNGDRLFALHSEENVFDVWETPTSPIL